MPNPEGTTNRLIYYKRGEIVPDLSSDKIKQIVANHLNGVKENTDFGTIRQILEFLDIVIKSVSDLGSKPLKQILLKQLQTMDLAKIDQLKTQVKI